MNATVAQSEEQRTPKAQVAGSIPVGGSILGASLPYAMSVFEHGN